MDEYGYEHDGLHYGLHDDGGFGLGAGASELHHPDEHDELQQQQSSSSPMFLSQQEPVMDEVDFTDPEIAALPRVLLMGPRRGGKTSLQVRLPNMIYYKSQCLVFCLTHLVSSSFPLLFHH